ncbi:DUF1828 domain-containing protein [Lentilactobacillus hilgardii]|nr:DUF1828 domain-containing protein [Lentilactobacillus hilgardii]MCV3742398.1 DUF1828 domain-containing protein [Lentilactobacillus hilgardii]
MNELSSQIDSIATDWLEFVKKSNEFRMASNDELRVNTPFTDPFGDSISLMITQNDSLYTVTDQGYTLWNLQLQGVDLKDKHSHRYKNLISVLKRNNAVLSKNNQISKTGDRSDLPQVISDLTQTIIQVSDLIYLNRTNTRSVFLDDVSTYFNSQTSRFSFLKGMSMQGQSNLKYNIDYIFNTTINDREFVNVYNNLSKSLVEQLIGIWMDTIHYRESHNQENVPFNIIVPQVAESQKKFVDSLSMHNISVIPFNDRTIIHKKLAIKDTK